MSRRGELDVIVVGAGAIGAALALAFARDGFDVALVEARAPKPWRADDEVDLRVVALAPDARELLSDLDVWPSILGARASAYRRMYVWDALAPGELGFDAADNGEATLGWIVENKLIQHALWQALRATESPSAGPSGAAWSLPGSEAEPPARAVDSWRRGSDARTTAGVRLHCPAHVVDIENASDFVTATLDDGVRLHAKVLVAAEGAESSLRDKLGIAFKGRDYGQRAVVAHVATERPHHDTAWQRFLPGGPLAFLPLRDGRSSIVWTLPDAEAVRILALDDTAFASEVACASDMRLGAIVRVSARAAFPLRLRLAERYVAGRCVLAGDAAHLVHPLAGQGMNLGFRDVQLLRNVVRAARGGDIGAPPVLRRYERERRSENALAAQALDGVERLFGTTSRPIAHMRAAGMALVNRSGALKHWFAAIAAGKH